MRRRPGRGAALLAAALLSACAPGHGRPASVAPTPQGPVWPVETREDVDLWLHGYALLTRDAAQVPVFRRGYRDSVEALRRRANVLTALDANHQKLATLMAQNPEIANGQFLPLYFDSWDQMTAAVHAFLGAQGQPALADPPDRQHVALIASMFPTAQDREWLRLFTQALGDESQHFFHGYWTAQEERRRPFVVAADSLWQSLRPRFQQFLTSTHQVNGDLVLSLALAGEGRTLNATPQHNVMVVGLPDSRAELDVPIYGFAHEAVQTITAQAIGENTTVAQQRSGEAGAYSATAAVRGGAMLIERAAPELLDGYMRFYLAQAGMAAPPGNAEPAFTAAFQLPSAILASIDRLVGAALGGS
ncbi:MAG: hypothetical protein KGO03_03050 [Gemmatimonadota bacterium]|nr:hypothetical protein [Gemmatimonadota bacterium]